MVPSQLDIDANMGNVPLLTGSIDQQLANTSQGRAVSAGYVLVRLVPYMAWGLQKRENLTLIPHEGSGDSVKCWDPVIPEFRS